MNITVIAMLPILLLTGSLFIAFMMFVFPACRRLLGGGFLMFGLLVFVGMFLLVPMWSHTRVRHSRDRQFLEEMRQHAEAVARRHAAEMQRSVREVQSAADAIPAAVLADVPAPVSRVAPPRPSPSPSAVGEISSEDDVSLLTQATAQPLDAADAEPQQAEILADETIVATAPPAPASSVSPPVTSTPVIRTSVTAPWGDAATAVPDWVVRPPDEVEGHRALVLVSDPYEDRFGCDEDLERRTRTAIEQLAQERCRQRGLPTNLKINLTYDELGMVAQQRHYQPRATSLGDMLQGYQLTVLDDAFHVKLDQRIMDAVVDRRLAATGASSAGVLLVVSLLFGIFRFAARKAPDPLST